MNGDKGNGQRIKDHDLLIRIDERVEKIHDTVKSNNRRYEKIEERVNEIEDWRKYIQGAVAMITIVSGTLHAKLFKFI